MMRVNGIRAAARRKARALTWLASALASLAFCSPALASGNVGAKIIRLCTNGKSISGFSVSAYRKALSEMETEVIEYTECPNLISEAENEAAAGGGAHRKSSGGGGPGGTSGGRGGTPRGGGGEAQPISSALIPTTPAEQHAIETARDVEPPEVMIGGDERGSDVTPGVVHADIASAASSLPTPVIAVLALLLALILLGAGSAVRDRLQRDAQ